MSFRTTIQERDFSGFVSAIPGETGAMVVLSRKGPNTPVLLEGEQDVRDYFGDPSSLYPSVFDLIEFAREYQIWGVSAYASDALFGGVDVKSSAVVPFGERSGRNIDTFAYGTVSNNAVESIATGDGLTNNFTGSVLNSPVSSGSLQILVGGNVIDASESGGVVTGTDISSGTFNTTTGAYNITLAGSVGTVASYTTLVDLTGGIDLSTVASAGVATISSSPTQFVGSVVPGLSTATYDLDVDVDGGGVDQLAISITNTDDWDTIAAAIETQLQTATGSTETVTISGGKIRIESATVGDSSTIVITAGTAGSGGGDLLTAISALAGYDTTIDAPVDGQNAGFSLIIDDNASVDVDLGASGTTTRTAIKAAIDAAVGEAVTADEDTGGEFITISGLIGSSTLGGIQIDSPTGDLQDAVVAAIDAAFLGDPISEDTAATSPTGAIPGSGQALALDYLYETDESSNISHSFFARSPMDDDDVAVEIEYIGNGTTPDYHIEIYKITPQGNIFLEEFDYSLTRKQNNFGQSLYIEDVFEDNKWVLPKINESYTGSPLQPTVTIVAMTGGERGGTVLNSDIDAAWDNFQKPNKFKAKIFMDSLGRHSKVLSIRNNFQKFSSVISAIPLGNDASDAITYRQGLGIDDDQIAFYTNWSKIRDDFNNSSALISRVGGIGVKYAQMSDVFNALSPAGVDENDHGGQLTGYTVIEMEQDYTDAQLEALDNAQLNPIVQDELYGPIILGDRTGQVDLSDTSYVGTRRLYNFIQETIVTQVLRQQEFKNNDRIHRDRAKRLTDEFLAPIINGEYLREVFVQCDERNNNDLVLNQRKFILDIFVKVTPNSQRVLLRFTRLSQTAVLSDFIVQ
jgi:hypothetical protein